MDAVGNSYDVGRLGPSFSPNGEHVHRHLPYKIKG